MHIRNDYSLTQFEVSSPKDIEALAVQGMPAPARWMMKCAFPEVQNLVGVASPEAREAICDRIDAALREHPEMLEHVVVCDDRNNPPSVVHNDQTIVTVHGAYKEGYGTFMLSFSNKEFL